MAVDAIGTGGNAAIRPRRLFTLAEANALLPSLVPILTRLRDNASAVVQTGARVRALDLQSGGPGAMQIWAELEARLTALRATIDEDLWMLEALGVELKSIEECLVDFPALRDGRVVYLCWRLGEGQISHWHEVDAGFAGRKPIE